MLDQYEKCCGEKTTEKPSVISRYPKCAAFHAKLKVCTLNPQLCGKLDAKPNDKDMT